MSELLLFVDESTVETKRRVQEGEYLMDLLLFVDVWNGEGYSEPTVEIISKLDYHNKMAAAVSGCDSMDIYEMWEATYTSGHDNGKVKTYPIKQGESCLITIMPDTLDVEIERFDSEKEAIKELVAKVLWSSMTFDEDDLAEFEPFDDLRFGSHTDDGFFYYEVITAGAEL